MFERLAKHGTKILVFLINILLMAIAIFVIREKDQARLFEKAQTENGSGASASTESNILPSFENSVSLEEQNTKDAGPADVSDPVSAPAPATITLPSPVSAPVSTPLNPASAPDKKASPSNVNVQTKTS